MTKTLRSLLSGIVLFNLAVAQANAEELAKLGQIAAATRQFKRDLRRAENIATSAVSKIMEARQVLGA